MSHSPRTGPLIASASSEPPSTAASKRGEAHASRPDGAGAAGQRRPSRATKGDARTRRTSRSARRLFAFDEATGAPLVAGADEAGRGSLAGPLVAAAVLFDYRQLTNAQRRALSDLDDSKQRTEQARERLYPLILAAAAAVTIVSRCPRGIDGRGLHLTNLTALADALHGVTRRLPEPAACLVDGFALPGLRLPHRAVIGGDARSAAIAAASIVAKVTRDRFMRHVDVLHPGWSFAEHVGYSTPAHREAIARLGVSPLHRMSFQSVAYAQLRLAEL